MGMIPEINLASRPDVAVRLREATVADAIDFSDVDVNREEKATTMFLDRLQDKATWTDPAKWTGEDRRLALFWYWMHTAMDLEIPLTYLCGHCGETHTQLADAATLAEAYKPMQGKPERDVEFDGTALAVRCLDGAALEEIEGFRIMRDEALAAHGENSGQYRKARARLRLMLFLRTLHIEGKSPDEVEKWLLGLPTSKFEALAVQVGEALESMAHGLPSTSEDGEIHLFAMLQCPNRAEERAVTKVSFPFRAFNYIPGV